MSTAAGGLNIVTNGLVMYLDAANTKSLSDVPSTNLITWSEDFTNANWGKSNLSVSGNTISSPIGTITADSLIENSLLAQHATTKTVTVTSGNTFTYSIYLKPNSRFNSSVWVFDSNYVNGFGGNFNLTAGTVTNISQGTGISNNTNQITNVGNGWYRCKITGTITTATTFNLAVFLLNNSSVSNYSGDGVSNLYVWGAQLEVGSVATTYIATTTAAVSRVPTWTDISRGGNNGTLINGVAYDYLNGGSLVFNGVNNYVNIPGSAINNFQPTNSFTINAIFKPTGMGSTTSITDNTSVVLGTGAAAGSYGIGFNYNQIAGTYNLRVGCRSTDNTYLIVDYPITLNTVYDVSLTYQTNGMEYIYVNGVQIYSTSTVAFSSKSFTPSTTFGFNIFGPFAVYGGNPRYGIGYFYKGSIYNRALSSQEVLQNYNTTKSKFGL